MKKYLPLAIALVLTAAIAAVLVATRKSREVLVFLGLRARPVDEKIYWCPMHPFYKVKKYGICPYCNMELEPYTPGPGTREAEAVLVLTPQQIQQAGVRTEKVRRRELVHEIETTGIVDLNHERYWHIEFRFEGWIEEIFLHNVGERIEVGGAVAKVYSPVLFSSQNDYLTAKASGDRKLLDAARRRLELMGVDEQEIRALEERKEPSARLTLRSKYAGTVMHLNVKAGSKVPEDGHIADVADLTELWVFADIFDRELANVAVGREARVEAAGRAVAGSIDLVEPRVKAETQTARVRIRVKNDPVALRPGQFARVLLLTRLPNLLAASEHAVIPTGRRDLVLVALGGGRFAACEVRIGRRWLTATEPGDDRGLGFFTGHNRFHEVLSGLDEGQEIVTSGAFLLHAETQIRNLLDKMAPEKEETVVRSRWSGRRGLTDAADEEAYRRDPPLSWERREPAVRRAMAALLERYFLVNRALDDRNEKLAEEYSEALAGTAQALREAVSDAFAEEVRRPILDVAKAASEAPAAKERRKHFGVVSRAIEAYLAEFGNPLDRPLFQFYCGMAQQTVGSPTERWFQPDGDLRNPFGMKKCGSLEKEIPARKSEDRSLDSAVFDAYFALHQAIVEKGDTKAAAASVVRAAEALEKSSEGDRKAFAAAMKTETHFGALSLAIERYLAKLGPPTDRPVYQFYCGMARDRTGSPSERWFQSDERLRNPFGMPGCGRLERRWP